MSRPSPPRRRSGPVRFSLERVASRSRPVSGWLVDGRRSLPMLSPFFAGLREHVVAARAAGASCQLAAARVGVGMSSASRLARRSPREGPVASKPMGDDHTWQRLEAHAALFPATSKPQPSRSCGSSAAPWLSGACRPSRADGRASSSDTRSDTRSPGKGALHAAEQEREHVRAALAA